MLLQDSGKMRLLGMAMPPEVQLCQPVRCFFPEQAWEDLALPTETALVWTTFTSGCFLRSWVMGPQL